MNINLKIGRVNNSLNVYGTNQTVSKDGDGTKKGMNPKRKDSVFISPMGRKNSVIESFIKQKQNIIEQKEKLKSSTIQKGGTLDSIKSQLESFDEQIKNIDKQIAKSMTEQTKKQVEEMKSNIYSKPKTSEEAQSEKFANIISNSSNLKRAEVISSVKRKIDGESRVLKAQIKTGYGDVESKKAEVEKLDKQSANLVSQVSEQLNKLAGNNKEDIVKKDKPNAVNNTDGNIGKLEEVD